MQVRDFRCIDDSTDFSVADVTCFVGKNESGKTALLKALHKVKPDSASKEVFSAARDYPRRKWRPDTAIPANPPTVTTVWQLDDSDVAGIEAEFCPGILNDRRFTLSVGYDNVRRSTISLDLPSLVKSLGSAAELTTDERKPLMAAKTPEAALEILRNLPERTPHQEALAATIGSRFPNGGETAVLSAVIKRVPTFLYFDEYLTLPGTVSVNAIVQRKQQNLLEERDRVFIALLALAGTTAEKVQEAGTFEEFNAALRAVSNQITDQIFAYWSQNRHLDVEIRLDHARPQDPAPFNSGWVFRTRINNRRHRADTSFDDRSRGFVWFFSFLVWFYQLRQEFGSNLVVLLDEPGLSLHARAQADLLRYINEQLRPHYQVLYTTHSPFMIDADNLLSARTVEDVVVTNRQTGEEQLLGTRVGEKILSVDPDTISPLQGALGYELTQTLFIGRHILLVEGPSDLLYLRWFSEQLTRRKKIGLDYRWNVCVVKGVDRIPGFVSLFRGNGLNIAAIVDVQGGDKARIENARAALSDGHLLCADSFAQQKEANIEDVIGRDFYVAIVNSALDLRGPDALSIKRAPGAARVAKEVEAHCATLPPHVREFNHFLPAEWLLTHSQEAEELPGFSEALERMERLISAANELIA